jgi:predicted phage tail protein
MPINPGLAFVIADTAANQLSLPQNRAIFYGTLGAILPTPVGLGVTLALAQQEAAAQPPPQSQPQPQPQPQPQLQPPGPVTNLQVTASTANTASLSWTAPSSGGAVATYAVQLSPHGANAWSTVSTGGTGTSFTISGLVPGTLYDLQVIAVNAAGQGQASNTVTAPSNQATVPGPVTGLAASAPTASTITLNWTAPATGGVVASYTVQYLTGSGDFATASDPIAGTSCTVTGLAAGTTYDFQVMAVNAAGQGQAATTTGTTSHAPAPASGAAESHSHRART